MLASVVLVLTVIDGGSIFLTRMSVPDAAKNAGYAAAAAAELTVNTVTPSANSFRRP